MEAATIVREGLAASQIKAVDMFVLSLPPGTEFEYANALAGIEIVQLTVPPPSSQHRPGFDRLLIAMTRNLTQDSKIGTLILNIETDSEDDIVPFLKGADGCKVPNLALHLPRWSTRFDENLIKHLRNNMFLQKLRVRVTRHDGPSNIAATASSNWLTVSYAIRYKIELLGLFCRTGFHEIAHAARERRAPWPPTVFLPAR